MGKILETRQLYKDMLREISKDETNWRNFLDSNSWNFKYDFDDQILIYAQRPDARACASMEEWNKKLKRWVNKNTKPIYIFDKNPYSEYPFRLIFDISDTHNSSNTEYKLWTVKDEYKQEIIESLEANFGDISSKNSLEQAITLASYNMVTDNIEDYLTNIIDNKTGSMIENLKDEEIKTIVISIVWASVSYMMMTRCGLDAKKQVELQEFSYIKYFNTQEILTTLGASISDIAEVGLREIAKTIITIQKNENIKNRTIEKIDKELYSDTQEKNKGGIENGGNQIRETGGLLYTQSSNGKRENTNREVRIDEVQLFEKSQELSTYNSSDEQRVNNTFNRNTRNGNEESEQDNREFSKTRGNERRIESQRSNEMGSTNEQLQDDSRGNSGQRNDLHLNNKRRALNENEIKSDKDFLQDKYTSDILANAHNLRASRVEIKEFFKENTDINERVKYLKQIFNDDYTEIVVDDERLGYKAYENVLHLWKGNYLNRTAEAYYKWETIAIYIEGMIIVNEFNDKYKPIPSFTNQMQILSIIEEENKPNIFTQEVIDTALQTGSHFADGKYRIYNQFEHSLSNKDNIRFLKNEYGEGGSSTIHIGTNIGIDFDSKGIVLYRGYKEDKVKFFMNWNKVEKRIGELIKLDRYLNPKEKEEYSKWRERQERENQLKESKNQLLEETQKVENDKEREIAKRIYTFVSDSDFYNYIDNSKIERSENDNIEVIKADISDKMNIKDYINALKDIIQNVELDSKQLIDAQDLIKILESRIQKYEYHLGDKIYIGADEYEFAGINNNIVTLYDSKFPLLNKQMEFNEFERRVQENRLNDHLILKGQTYNDKKESVTKKVQEEKNIFTDNVQEEKIDVVDDKIIEEIKPIFTKKNIKIKNFDLYPNVEEKDRINYKITNNNLGEGTPKEKFENNIQAIKILKQCEKEKRYATKEEQEILSKYVGWGGLQEAFDKNNDSWSKEYSILKEILTEDEYATARASTLTAFYTPPIVINAIYKALQNMGLKEANILEPSCGTGNFFGMLPKELEKCKMYGIEIDSISGRIAQQLYQKNTIAVQGFEKVELPDSFFDVAVGNVPFGDFRIVDKKYDKNKFLIHDYFFGKTLDKVRQRRNSRFYYLKRNNG